MNSRSNRLHLVVPGLLGPMDRLAESGLTPRTQFLEWLLARADRHALIGDHISTLFGLFDYRVPPDADWPSAAVCRFGEGGAENQDYWLHADPVFLKPDMDRLLLSDARVLNITPGEAGDLVQRVERHFADQGWRLEVSTPRHWFLRLPEPPRLSTSPLHEVVGRSIFSFLPRGADMQRWRGLLNEAQMLLHHTEVNQRRRELGNLEINGLWLWGGGSLPDLPLGVVDRVFSDHPLAVGLGRLTGTHVEPLHQDPERLVADGESVIFEEDLLFPVLDLDARSWCERLEQRSALMETLVGAIRRRHIDELLLYPCNGHCYRVKRFSLRRFWRRSKPVAHLVASASS